MTTHDEQGASSTEVMNNSLHLWFQN